MFPQSWLSKSRQLRLIGLLTLVGTLLGVVSDVVWNSCTSHAFAQIVPDDTLDRTSAVIPFPFAPSVNLIDGGTTRGVNLFHSFRDFNIETGVSAYFISPDGIENILARVTGSNQSLILGTLGTLGNPNLFLINPNGIVFGRDARLDVGGSFVATTANAIAFGDQGFFSASTPEVPSPLLTVNPSAFFFNQLMPGAISYQSVAPNLTDPSNLEGLNVLEGKSLLLIGGNMSMEGGVLVAPEGRVEIASVAGSGTVSLNIDNNSLRLNVPERIAQADIFLTNRARILTSGSGEIQLLGRRVTLDQGSQIVANNLTSGAGGTLTVSASESLTLMGTSADGRFSGLFTQQTKGSGAAGNLLIETGTLIVQDGAQISAGTFSVGGGGTLTVNASESIELSGTTPNARFRSGLFTQTQGAGTAGDLMINTRRLIVRDGAWVSASTLSEGDGGKLTVNASDFVELIGTSAAANNPDSSGLFVVTQGDTGAAGDLEIETGRLVVRDGAVVTASTFGGSQGRGGTLTVNATESVELIGTASNGAVRSGLFVNTSGTEAAGDLNIETGQLIVRDGAQVTVSSEGSSNAGNLEVIANVIELNNRAALSATTRSGKGGDITLQVRDFLRSRHNSNISTTAGLDGAGGDGGNIKISAPFILAVPLEDSDIAAKAFEGKGGNIQITAQGIFGIQFREESTPLSDITASSTLGVDGVVQINTPEIDPSRGLATLPAQVVDASGLIASNCGGTDKQRQSRFVVTGRGGLPESPNQSLSSDTVWTDLRSFSQQAENRSSATVVAPSNYSPSSQLVEAQGWVINNKGEVVLVAQGPEVTPQSAWLTVAGCRTR